MCKGNGITASRLAFSKIPTTDDNQDGKAFFNVVLNVFASMCGCFHSLMFISMRLQIWSNEGGKLGARKEWDEKTEGQAKPGLN